MVGERKYFRVRPERDYVYATTLAVDWGSEAVRAMLYFAMENGEPVHKILQHFPVPGQMHLDRHESRRQFTSHIYPFDHTTSSPAGELVYPGNRRLPGHRSISSKLAMYAVVGLSDDVARQSPELRELCAMVEDNPDLKNIIRFGIEQIMFHVLGQISNLMTTGPALFRRGIDAVALTVPAQWTIEFEEEYGERFMTAWEQVFGFEAPELIFLSEGQTNVHYAFYRDTFDAMANRLHLNGHDLFDIGRTKNGVLLIDAGGHSTNTSLVTICQDNNQLEIRPDRGAIGGTALWAWHVLEMAKSVWSRRGQGQAMPVEMENYILKMFHYQLPEFRDHTGAQFHVDNFGPHKYSFHYSITPAELVQAFDDANEHAFALIEEGILELSNLQRGCERIKIVIGGGSAQGPMWVDRMDALCTKHGMDPAIYLWQIDQICEYLRLAAGANYALAKARSVAQFADSAAFGLAVMKRFRGTTGWTYDWHYRASMLWARGNKWARSITTDGTEEFKIICQPDYNNPRPKSFIEPNYKAYDLLPIPCRKKGTLQFEFEIDTDTDKLKLKIKHRAVSRSGKTGRAVEVGSVEFDLWVPPGSRCLQIWDCIEDIEPKVAAAFSDEKEPEGEDVADADEDEEMDVDPGAVAQPAQQARSLGRRTRSQAPEPDDDVDMDAAAPKQEEEQDGDGDLLSAAPLHQAQADAPQPPDEDVEMSGMGDADEAADSITVATAPEEPAQPPSRGGQALRRRRRRGSRVPTGVSAVWRDGSLGEWPGGERYTKSLVGLNGHGSQ